MRTQLFTRKIHFSPSRATGGTDFRSPFTLGRHNILAFLKTVSHYQGIYAFDGTTNELAIAPEICRHKEIADTELGRYKRDDIVAANVDIIVSNKSVRILFHNESPYFGRPTQEGLKQLGEHIARLLRSIGVLRPATETAKGLFNLKTTIKFNLPGKD